MASKVDLKARDEHLGAFARQQVPDNCIEYMIFCVADAVADDSRPALACLESIRKDAIQLADKLTYDHIWQRDAFNLETKVYQGLTYLYGVSHYGDCVEDEWLIVYMLRELTMTHPHIWVRVCDSDGEFLLVEAAATLPKWLSPEIDANRVWIHQGKLRIIPSDSATKEDWMEKKARPPTQHNVAAMQLTKSISLREAVETLKTSTCSLIHSPFIEAEAFYRLEKYPGRIAESDHHALATIPRNLAFILHARPKAIAPATEALYFRDPGVEKLLFSPERTLAFPPHDLVTVSIRFTRVLFAQLQSQRLACPLAWKAVLDQAEIDAAGGLSSAEKKLARLELGMKVTSAFEILVPTAPTSSGRVAREVALLLGDLQAGGEACLPSDASIRTWTDVDREDDDAWMAIDYRDLERELEGHSAVKIDGKENDATSRPERVDSAGFGDIRTQTDLRKIVSRFESFLNDERAGIDGAEIEEMDRDNDDDDDDESDSDLDSDLDDDGEAEDKAISFDEEQFTQMMREMMGLPADGSTTSPTAAANSRSKGKELEQASPDHDLRRGHEDARGNMDVRDSEGDDDDNGDETQAIHRLMSQMEQELRQHNALTLNPSQSSSKSLEAGDQRAVTKKTEGGDNDHVDSPDGEDDDGDIDIDYSLLQNLLESYKSQEGMAGPAGNILRMMGMHLPRDDGDDYNEPDDQVRGIEGSSSTSHQATQHTASTALL